VTAPPPVASTSVPGIDPAAAFAALGNPLRWAIYQMLARGEALTASQAAGRLKRDFDGVSKHLRVMRSAGVVASRRSEEDGRLELYYIPTTLRRADGVVDLGFCAIRVPGSTM
jgi:predicted transcriptional regulator